METEFMNMRDGYRKGLVDAGMSDTSVVVLTGDLTESTHVDRFAELFPERFIQVGIAEQNMVSIAAGLSFEGKIPFVSTYAAFLPMRTLDQIRMSVCFSQANVKFVSTHVGLGTGPDGGSAQALEDIAVMRVLPNMTVVVPCDMQQAMQATLAIAQRNGPCYMRLSRNDVASIPSAHHSFEIGKVQVLLEGRDITLIACGPMVHEALVAAKELEKHHILCEVINLHTIVPLDHLSILKTAKKTRCIITVEDHQIDGGMGSAIAEYLSEHCPTPIYRMGVANSFGESGKPEELYKKHKLTSQDIEAKVRSILNKKK